MLKIAVCDDEQNNLHDLETMLYDYGTQRGIDLHVSSFMMAFDLSEEIEKSADFDLYLLDIYMPGMNGIQIAQQLRRASINTPIIFLTTSTDHALEAFGVGASGYLIKPYQQEDLFHSLDAVIERTHNERRRSILLKVNGEIRSISVRDILYCEAHKNNQQIQMVNGDSFQVRMTTGELYTLLSPSGNFAHCGSAYLLNLAKVKRMNPKSALMDNDIEIPIPRGSYADLKQAYFDFYSERLEDTHVDRTH